MAQFGKRVATADKSELKGLPLSDWDIKNIARLINLYSKAFPGYIEHHARQAAKEVESISKQSTFKKSELNFSKRMSMPQELLRELKRAYPAIISDKRQFEQFLRSFPQFDLHKK